MDLPLTVIIFSFGVGITISVDIFFFTLVKASVENLNWLNWTLPAAISHILLMGVVIGLFYVLGNTFDYLHLPLGIIGAAIIGRYLYELCQDWLEVETAFSLINWLEEKFGQSIFLSWLSASVLAVSWDCIPVAAGIASETENWSIVELVFGLLVIGTTVAIATQTSLILAEIIKYHILLVSKNIKVFLALLGNWVILSLLGGFLLLSLSKSFRPWIGDNWDFELYQTLPISSIMATLFFLFYLDTLWKNQMKVAVDA